MKEKAYPGAEFASAIDVAFMDYAMALAERGVALASPNPHVGAVLVRDGKIVGEGFHAYDGLRHAEVIAMDAAGEAARGATLYINLEPCCHTGRTGPCTNALIGAGVARVVAAMPDPNPAMSGRGFKHLRAAGIDVIVGLRGAEARRLNEAFAQWIITKRPLVTLKSALTLDGQLVLPHPRGRARPPLKDRWISSEQSRAEVQRMRHASDALLTGIGTVLADDPLLTDRTGLPRRRKLLRAVMDSRLRLPVRSKLVRSADGDVVVFTHAKDNSPKARALRRAGVEVVRVAGRGPKPDLREVIAELGRREILSVLLEAGATLNSAALVAGIVDKMRVFFAPKVAGFNGVTEERTAFTRPRTFTVLRRHSLAPMSRSKDISTMFTGLVEYVGTIESFDGGDQGARIRVNAGPLTDGLAKSGSIAVNGCCLTATEVSGAVFSADLSGETLRCTSLGGVKPGTRVNLERPLTAVKELGGHFMQGHVDGVGRATRLDSEGPNWWFGVRVPDELARYVAMKGSIALDGISLTVAGWHDGVVETAIIPFTYDHTNLSSLTVGDPVNVEVDILAKYVERFLESREEPAAPPLTVARLIEEGF